MEKMLSKGLLGIIALILIILYVFLLTVVISYVFCLIGMPQVEYNWIKRLVLLGAMIALAKFILYPVIGMFRNKLKQYFKIE